MVNRYLPNALLIIGLLLCTNFAFAQGNKSKKQVKKATVHERWELGLFLGASQYQGDMNNIGLKELHPAYGALLRYHITDNFALRTNILLGKLSGKDSNFEQNKTRGFSYSSPLTEFSLLGEYDIFGKKRYADIEKGKFRKMLSPYLFTGVAYSAVNPTTDFNENKIGQGGDPKLVQKDKNEKIKKGYVTLPVGLGLKYDINKQWNIGLEAGIRFIFNDYLDRVSQSANPKRNDTYLFGGLNINYRFPSVKDKDNDGVADDLDMCPDLPGSIKAKGCPDKDNDGISDRNDDCPDVAGIRAMNGCPDADRDGIADKDDDCPDIIGLKELKGCPDTDEDGIADKDDECPDQKGVADYRGCPVRDTDKDGIEDKLDKCPTQKGTKENNGCPVQDTDKDGFPDNSDDCPTVAGKLRGCPDTDADGIANQDDKCPNEAGVKANQGCPEIKAEDKKVLDKAVYGVQFLSGKASLTNASSEILNQVLDVLNKYPDFNLKISGYTDNLGNDTKNLILSENRAKACFQYFVNKGIDKSRMTYQGLGETNPIADNATAQGRAKNRRVVFELQHK